VPEVCALAVEKIISRIMDEAERSASEVLADARARSRKILREAKKVTQRKVDAERRRGAQRIETLRNIYISEARRDARKCTLAAKEELIEECFSQARDALRNLRGKEYERTLRRLIERGMALVGNECTAIPSREEDVRILSSYNTITVSDERLDADALGGVVLRSRGGEVVVDNTFNGIINRLRDDLRTKVAYILFSEETGK
jgi:V/A-type H+-transporting ATPase subunit E